MINGDKDGLDIFGWCQCIFNRPNGFLALVFFFFNPHTQGQYAYSEKVPKGENPIQPLFIYFSV